MLVITVKTTIELNNIGLFIFGFKYFLISKHLYTRNIPDPDLLIRTGGEMRVSNYLLWQIAYSEFIVLNKFWPEFDKDVLAECILEYKRRNRRFGK